MKYSRILSVLVFLITVLNNCERNNENLSGVYCLNIQNVEMMLTQSGSNVTFSLGSGLLNNGTGIISGDTLILNANTSVAELFEARLTLSGDRNSFAGPFVITDPGGATTFNGILQGTKGECIKYDIAANGIPKFVEKDFTELSMIEKISRFRSGFGHSYTDSFENCRSMKHYYNPYPEYRQNNTVGIFSPVTGTIISVLNDGGEASTELKNQEIQIRPDSQPAFIIVLFHSDLISSVIKPGKKVEAGELLGYGRLYYEEQNKFVTSFDIAVWVNTPSGMKLVSYFETLQDYVFDQYIARGASSLQDFIITREARDSDPLECNGETFLNSGTINNWVNLN